MKKRYCIALMGVVVFSNCSVDLKGMCDDNDDCVPGYLCKSSECLEIDPVQITTGKLIDATDGVEYSQLIKASLGVPPYKWILTTHPDWMSIQQESGNLHGVPVKESDIIEIEVSVVDSTQGRDNSDTKKFQIIVHDCIHESTTECSKPIEEICWEGIRTCNQGNWGPCEESQLSDDIDTCDKDCGPCPKQADGCVEGLCVCGTGTACNPEMICCDGLCIDQNTDRQNCGDCGIDCKDVIGKDHIDGICNNGQCVECSIDGDCPNKECNRASCSEGVCVYTPMNEGNPCGVGIQCTEYSDCDYSDFCDQMGERSRTCTPYKCSSGQCNAGTPYHDTDSCTRDTTNTVCESESCGSCESCDWSGTCDESAPGKASCMKKLCSGGLCSKEESYQKDCDCTRHTDNMVCVAESCGSCENCGWSDSCDEAALGKVQCSQTVCQAGACSNVSSYEKDCDCNRDTDGVVCVAESCGPCGGCDWLNLCDESATGEESCTVKKCQTGTCSKTINYPNACTCTRDTDGNFCKVQMCTSPPNTFRDICCSGGTCGVVCSPCTQ